MLRDRIDHKVRYFDTMWAELLKFFNSADWMPENEWAEHDCRIAKLDLRGCPNEEWKVFQLRKCYNMFKGLFAHCDDFYRRSENLEVGCNIDEADRFFVHAKNAANDSASADSTMSLVLLFCFLGF